MMDRRIAQGEPYFFLGLPTVIAGPHRRRALDGRPPRGDTPPKRRVVPERVRGRLQCGPPVVRPGRVGLTPELIGTLYPILLFKDCPPDVGPAAMGKVRRQPMSVFTAGVSITEKRENTVPRYYVETLRDLVITPGQQRARYERRGVKHVYTLDTGHTAMYADPQGVANILGDVSAKQG